MKRKPDIHDRLVIDEATEIARALIEDELRKAGVDYPSPEQIETGAYELLASNPTLFQAAYDKLRRN